MSKSYFTSDTHYYHANVIKKSRRPYATLEDMHRGMIDNWNRIVSKHDIVYHLGDFFLITKPDLIDNILGQLNGTIRLIRGNHDKWINKIPRLKNAHKIEWVKDYFEHKVQLQGQSYLLVMSHYPMRTWNKSHYGSIQLHGHCHGFIDEENKNYRRMDVGVDSNNYSPISLEKVILVNEHKFFTYHHDYE